MKTYNFTREAKYIQFGFVNADSAEQAIELIKDGDYDDIYDTSLEEEYNDTISLKVSDEADYDEDDDSSEGE